MNSKLTINSTLSFAQSVAVIASTLLALGLITLPRGITEEIQSADGWIVFILAVPLALVFNFIIGKLSAAFPKQTLYEYSPSIIGKMGTRLLALGYIIYFTPLLGLEIRAVGELIHYFLLDETPFFVILVTFAFISSHLALSGLQVMSRVYLLFFVLTICVLLMIIALSFSIFDVTNLMPVLREGPWPVVKALPSTGLYFLGIEMLLFISGNMETKQISLVGVLSILIAAFLYILIYIVVIGGIGMAETEHLTWPTISLVQSYEIEGLFFERFEIFFIFIWLMQIFTFTASLFYMILHSVAQVFSSTKRKAILFVFPLSLVIAYYPQNINQLFEYLGLSGMGYYYGAFVVPIVLLLVHKIRRRVRRD
ncbi:GerAB/ArcD/ProY family transporter [Bacillaceae bacterium SIJ1]|uniref:GerAB/ArcD/ProY family transporter n=1 Tax=Litoribacterium kuwaitense TaxID=1398745 RepID=UPI0013ED88A9|nr:GerAB/ArcD/ProY family transporter [Litoribacterium kuwaitense]NGP45060.1 GerAB/ArcD/ProY family transporter [Litoribacterium kuwaitense]